MRCTVSSTTVAVAAVLAVACSKFEERAAVGGLCRTNGDCRVGLVCDPSGICVEGNPEPQPEKLPEAPPDIQVEVVEALDVAEEEATVLPEEVEEAPDQVEEGEEGLPEEVGEPVVPDEAPEAEVTDQPEAEVVENTTGLPCAGSEDCVDGTCVEVIPGVLGGGVPRVCTGPCEEGEFCPSGMMCVPVGKAESGYRYECRPFPLGLCRACQTADDCPAPGAQCLGSLTDFFCSAPCPPDGEGNPGKCPEGFDCKVIPEMPEADKYQCVPTIGTCACNEATASALLSCSLEAGGDRCWGEMDCTPGKGWGKCPAFLPEPGTCHERRPNCEEPSLDTFKYLDFDSMEKTIGQSCGTGECDGGTVVCGGGGAATCSSLDQRLADEYCGDGKDNDCDGKTDEAPCPDVPDDIDGDGDINDTDCDPIDPAKHRTIPGKLPAKEPCCPPGVPEADRVKVCDYDCDGDIRPCDANDQDLDGYVAEGLTDSSGNPGTDCDDTDPQIFPGAPDKCNDGVDQDCLEGDLDCVAEGIPDKDGDGYIQKWDTADNDPDIHPWAEEVCNYIDDDCDGVVDNHMPSGQDAEGEWRTGGSDCGSNVGECRFGDWVCTHFPGGARMECLFEKGPGPETCNDKDDNCDSITDDPWVDPRAERVKGQLCDSDDMDECQNGMWACSPDGKSLVCTESMWDVVEVCANKKDDDCDGVVDDGCFPEDLDGDGYSPDAADPALRDCNNLDAATHPGAIEPCCDPVLTGQAAVLACDKNCDGDVTPCSAQDEDLDGYLAKDDCDDADPMTHPGAAEKCGDGKDQNCDDLDIPCEQVQDGDEDGYGLPGDCDDTNPDQHPGATELCNMQDDDCDGNTDDGNPEGGEGCGSSAGECRPGILACVHYAYSAKVECVPEVPPAREICNGKDDNCNGFTDEYFPELKKACDGPDGDACKNGVIVCSPGGLSTVCGTELVEDIKEVCDGVDNDCDGETDEGFLYPDPATGQNLPLGAVCDGFGLCGQGTVECATDKHRATCSTNADGSASEAVPEKCNGLDEDCDGQPDNGIYYQGLSIGSMCLGYGTCGLGRVECNAAGGATCSSNPDGSKPKAKVESCDGKDNDCDGHTDEGVIATAWDCKRFGVCENMKIPAVCRRGAWECDYSGVPGYIEVELECDQVDNNCDGKTDEGFPYDGATVGEACDGRGECGAGTVVCISPDASTCSTNPGGPDHVVVPETCNGLDDDCDGTTDDGFDYAGIALGAECDGVGECGVGTVVCAADGTHATCSTNPDGNAPEVKQDLCNGLDDDCDGTADEEYPLGEGCDTDDPDLCAAGHYECNAEGTWVTCVGDEAGASSQEVCDGKDNDCNGQADEPFPYEGLPIGEPCDGIGRCGMGFVECFDLTRSTCSTNPDGSNRQDQPEVCNGEDDDCDGQTDEGQTWNDLPLGAACTAPGVCGGGQVVCSPTDHVATCSTLPNGTDPRSSPEVCDGEDNDCNGLVDDVTGQDLSGCKMGGVCTPENVRAICANGVWNCDYSGVPYWQEVESGCDMRDNDCNGVTDDGYFWQGLPIGADCDGIGACGAGKVVCSPAGTGATCSTNPDGTTPQNIKERCSPAGTPPENWVDEDCDGESDEEGAQYCAGYYLDQDGDKYGKPGIKKCLCRKDQVPGYSASAGSDCDDTNADVHPKAVELCNDRDDNCDGTIDDGYPDKGLPCAGPPPNDQCKNGTWTCSPDGTGVVCTGYHISPELCNGLDDDCDGATDEDFSWNGVLPGGACDGIGECPVGTVVCISDNEATCSTNPNGPDPRNTDEKCNGKDDNCDGSIDELWPEKGKPCDGSDADFCPQGIATCKSTGDGTECKNEPVPPSPPTTELCDHIDNDCSGVTDDQWVCAGKGPDEPCKGRKCDVVINPMQPENTCKTGWWTCNKTKLGLECVNETECAYMAQCKSSGVDTLPDECHCGTHNKCTTEVATQCVADQCKCGAGPACTPPQKCVAGTCKNP